MKHDHFCDECGQQLADGAEVCVSHPNAMVTSAPRRYTTRRDAEQAVRAAIFDVPTPASAGLVAQVSDRCWRGQMSVHAALESLAAEGEDCEGFER